MIAAAPCHPNENRRGPQQRRKAPPPCCRNGWAHTHPVECHADEHRIDKGGVGEERMRAKTLHEERSQQWADHGAERIEEEQAGGELHELILLGVVVGVGDRQ